MKIMRKILAFLLIMAMLSTLVIGALPVMATAVYGYQAKQYFG